MPSWGAAPAWASFCLLYTSSGTRLKVLADYIDIGYSVLSIGDVLVRVMGFLAVYATLRHLSQKAASKELG